MTRLTVGEAAQIVDDVDVFLARHLREVIDVAVPLEKRPLVEVRKYASSIQIFIHPHDWEPPRTSHTSRLLRGDV